MEKIIIAGIGSILISIIVLITLGVLYLLVTDLGYWSIPILALFTGMFYLVYKNLD